MPTWTTVSRGRRAGASPLEANSPARPEIVDLSVNLVAPPVTALVVPGGNHPRPSMVDHTPQRCLGGLSVGVAALVPEHSAEPSRNDHAPRGVDHPP